MYVIWHEGLILLKFNKFRHGDFFETERKSRVKMYKKGKSWVKACLSSFGLLRLFSVSEAVESIENIEIGKEHNEGNSKYKHLVHGVLGAGAVFGAGSIYSPNILANELPNTKESSQPTLAETDSTILNSYNSQSSTEPTIDSEVEETTSVSNLYNESIIEESSTEV